MSSEVVIVKLGGSLITDKRATAAARHDVITRLAGEIADAAPPGGLILGHGSGSFGHVAAARHRVPSAAARGDRTPGLRVSALGAAITQDSAARLHRLVVEALVDADAVPCSLPPSAWLRADEGRPRTGFLLPLELALSHGRLPVVYGDVVADTAWGASVVSTETVVRFLIPRLQRRGYLVRRLLWLGETNGVYDAAGQTIPEISASRHREALRAIVPAGGTDVTGGMRLRLDTARWLARRGLESWIVDGRRPGLLAAALRGEDVPGTRYLAEPAPPPPS